MNLPTLCIIISGQASERDKALPAPRQRRRFPMEEDVKHSTDPRRPCTATANNRIGHVARALLSCNLQFQSLTFSIHTHTHTHEYRPPCSMPHMQHAGRGTGHRSLFGCTLRVDARRTLVAFGVFVLVLGVRRASVVVVGSWNLPLLLHICMYVCVYIYMNLPLYSRY